MMDQKQINTIAISVGISSVFSALLTFYLVTSHIEAAMYSAPKIAIGGFTEMFRSIPAGTNKAEIERVVNAMEDDIKRLSSDGFIIIDDRTVMSAPKEFYIPIASVDPSQVNPISPNAPEVVEPETADVYSSQNNNNFDPSLHAGIASLFKKD